MDDLKDIPEAKYVMDDLIERIYKAEQLSRLLNNNKLLFDWNEGIDKKRGPRFLPTCKMKENRNK